MKNIGSEDESGKWSSGIAKLCLGDLLVMGSNQFFIYIVTNHYHIDPYVADPCVRKRFDCYCCICLTY